MSIFFTITRDSTILLSEPLLVTLAVGGTAIFGTDYTVAYTRPYPPSQMPTFTATTATLWIPAGELDAGIAINPVADVISEPNETVILSIVPTVGVSQVGVNASATGMILNDDLNGNVDPYWNDVTFLLKADANGFSDIKGSRVLISAGATSSTTARFVNSVQISNGYISIPNPNTLIPSVGDWTIDWWYRHQSTSSYGSIFNLDGSDYPLIIFYGSSVSPNILVAVGTNSSWYSASALTIPAPSTSQFDYYGIKREGGVISTWKNGVQTSSDTVAVSLPIGVPSGFANLGFNSNNYNNGYYEEFRITNIARNLSIVPTAPFATN